MPASQVTQLPVRCDNGHWHMTTASVMGIGTGIRVTLRGVRYGPCPACGADGLIEDGAYCVRAGLRGRLAMAWSALRRGYV